MHITNLDQLIGQRVVVTADHGTSGFFIAERHIRARRIGAVGTVQGWVPGYGGDVVYITQEDTPHGEEPVAVYCHYNGELEFYSPEALVFALLKAERVKRLEGGLKRVKEERFALLKAKRIKRLEAELKQVKEERFVVEKRQ